MSAPKVVITGLGAVTAAGFGARTLWEAARDGRSGVANIEFTRPFDFKVLKGAQVRGLDPKAQIPDIPLSHIDRFSQFAILATEEALAHAGLAKDGISGSRTACIIGTGIGGVTSVDDGLYGLYTGNYRIDPMTIPRAMANGAASQITMRYSINGPSFAVSSACSSSTQAIGIGLTLVRSGLVDRALVGGSEALITPGPYRAWEAMRVMTPTLCRPFSKDRNGMVLGEGGAMLVLEREDVAKARGATILAELAGYGTTSDGKDIIRPDLKGTSDAIRLALADAGLAPDEIDYVNAHGTATVLNDQVESAAIAAVFGERSLRLPVSSTKPIHGHTLGAAGAIEMVITVQALRDQIAPPTINWNEADPACPIDPVANEARNVPMRAVLSNSFAFGGINACLVVKAA